MERSSDRSVEVLHFTGGGAPQAPQRGCRVGDPTLPPRTDAEPHVNAHGWPQALFGRRGRACSALLGRSDRLRQGYGGPPKHLRRRKLQRRRKTVPGSVLQTVPGADQGSVPNRLRPTTTDAGRSTSSPIAYPSLTTA